MTGELICPTETLLEAKAKLEQCGYTEANSKPNLFYKKIFKKNGEYETLFAHIKLKRFHEGPNDLEIYIYPIYKEGKTYTLNNIDFVLQKLLLQKNLNIPIKATFYRYHRYYYGYHPSGNCLSCDRDILLGKDLSKLQNPNNDNLDPTIELFYCDTCKAKIYEKRRLAKLCFHCKEREWKIEHHITYGPPFIIRLCYKCHGRIHSWGFPNFLWRQKKSEYEEIRKQERKEKEEQRKKERERKLREEAKKPVYRFTCNRCDTEKFSNKPFARCPVCNKNMKKHKKDWSNFHCSFCLKTWEGIVYQDQCIQCSLNSSNILENEDKIVLRMNIESLRNPEQREEYRRLYEEKFGI